MRLLESRDATYFKVGSVPTFPPPGSRGRVFRAGEPTPNVTGRAKGEAHAARWASGVYGAIEGPPSARARAYALASAGLNIKITGPGPRTVPVGQT